MTETEIFENLCYYDPRRPDFDPEVALGRKPSMDCACDNCFYGRDKLAIALLSGIRTEAWVLQLEPPTKQPYYARGPFCGGTHNILEAARYETKPESLGGVPVRVTVVTDVETVTDG